MPSSNNEFLYYVTLQRIAKQYMTTGQLQRKAEKEYGVSYHEALEMSYENIQAEAADAIRGKRLPKLPDAIAEDVTGAEVVQKDAK